MDEQSRSERELETAGASIGGPTYGSRPAGTKFAASRSGLAALPTRPPASPHFTGPREPNAGAAIGRVTTPWYKAKWLWVIGSLALVVVIAGVALSSGGDSKDDNVQAAAGAPAPTGYRMIKTESYRFAVPTSWTTKALDAQVMNPEATPDTSADHSLIVATDPDTRDTINVVPYEASSASLQKRLLAEFEADFRNGVSDSQIIELRVDPATVHGLKAGRLTASVVGPDGPAKVISTIVETESGLFQITVTAATADRANVLDEMVLPTFDIR